MATPPAGSEASLDSALPKISCAKSHDAAPTMEYSRAITLSRHQWGKTADFRHNRNIGRRFPSLHGAKSWKFSNSPQCVNSWLTIVFLFSRRVPSIHRIILHRSCQLFTQHVPRILIHFGSITNSRFLASCIPPPCDVCKLSLYGARSSPCLVQFQALFHFLSSLSDGESLRLQQRHRGRFILR